MKRVVITGAGTVNPLGLNVPDTLAAMRNGVCGIGPLDFRDVDRLSIKIGGQVHGFDGESQYNRQKIALYDRFTQFTLAAAAEAIATRVRSEADRRNRGSFGRVTNRSGSYGSSRSTYPIPRTVWITRGSPSRSSLRRR